MAEDEARRGGRGRRRRWPAAPELELPFLGGDGWGGGEEEHSGVESTPPPVNRAPPASNRASRHLLPFHNSGATSAAGGTRIHFPSSSSNNSGLSVTSSPSTTPASLFEDEDEGPRVQGPRLPPAMVRAQCGERDEDGERDELSAGQ